MAIRNESRYPATSEPEACAVRAAATVARTANPTAAPVCWPAVNRAPARPWSPLLTPAVMVIEAVGRARPMPSAVNRRPGRTAVT